MQEADRTLRGRESAMTEVIEYRDEHFPEISKMLRGFRQEGAGQAEQQASHDIEGVMDPDNDTAQAHAE